MTFSRVLAVALALLLSPAALAQEHQDHPERPNRPDRSAGERANPRGEQHPQGPGVLSLLPPDSTTEHTLEADGVKLAYTATAGTLNLYEQSGERTAAIFYTAYVLKGGGPNRPVTFVFNGGPGAASAYLHLGLVGPKVLDFGPGARDAATARLRDNPQTWLAFTDLVLIDPIGTGWSRTAKPDNTSFYGVSADAQVMAKAVALYLAHAGRTAGVSSSPLTARTETRRNSVLCVCIGNPPLCNARSTSAQQNPHANAAKRRQLRGRCVPKGRRRVTAA